MLAAGGGREHQVGYVGLEVERGSCCHGAAGETYGRKSLHVELDVEALAAARQWLSTPGRRHDQPVRVLFTIELTFRLKP